MLLSQLQAWIVCLASEHGVSLDGVVVGCGPQETRNHSKAVRALKWSRLHVINPSNFKDFTYDFCVLSC